MREDTPGDTVGGGRHLENALCRSGSCPLPRGCDIIKGGTAVLHFSLMRPFSLSLFPHVPPALTCVWAECLQLVPDQTARPARTERREGPPWSTQFRRPARRKGARKLIAGMKEGAVEKVFLRTSLLGLFFVLLYFVVASKRCVVHRGIQVSEVLWETRGKKVPR